MADLIANKAFHAEYVKFPADLTDGFFQASDETGHNLKVFD
jgi:hypothetical protein